MARQRFRHTATTEESRIYGQLRRYGQTCRVKNVRVCLSSPGFTRKYRFNEIFDRLLYGYVTSS